MKKVWILGVFLCTSFMTVFAQNAGDAYKEGVNNIGRSLGDIAGKSGFLGQTALYFLWDPAFPSIGGALNIQMIYPYHIEVGFGSFDDEMGLSADIVQFVWEPGNNNFGWRLGFGCPFVVQFGEKGYFSLVPQGIIGFYAGGGNDDWFGVFVEARPGFKIGLDEGAPSGFSIPIAVGFGTTLNLFAGL